MARRKIGVVGAGNVGATAAQRIAEQELGDVVLIDIVEGVPQGKGLDLAESGPVEGFDARIDGTNDYEALTGAELVVITAGLPRKPGMSRDDLLMKNAEIVRTVVERTVAVAPDCFLVVVSNPLDVMTQLAWKVSRFPSERVIGMAGVLDSTRFRTFIAWELGVSVRDVHAMVLGGHGDDMVPLARYATVGGIPIGDLLAADRIEALIDRTRKGGGEIVAHLKTGSAFYAPSSSVVEMAAAILGDRKRLLPVCALCSGQYGLDGVYVGVPCILGARGVEKILDLDLTDGETAQLRASADHVRQSVAKLGL